MNLKYLIVHELKKNVTETKATVETSNDVLPIDEASLNLVSELNLRYSKQRNTKITYATFDKPKENKFPKEFIKYNSNQTKDNFIKFSKESINNLRERIESNAPAKGGYLVFTDFEEYGHYVGVYLIRNTSGVLFKKSSESNRFEINPAIHIDFEKMAMACRINMDKYQDDDGRYLGFIDVKKDEVSKFFNNWISSKDQEDNITDSKYLLYDVLKQIEPPIDENNNPINREIFLEEVQNFIKNSPNRTVELKSLSTEFYDNEDFIQDFVFEKNIPINSQFKADSGILKRFINIKVQAEKISLSFPPKLFNDKIKIDDTNKDMIVITSKSLVEKIRKEIED